jgi:alanine racemase
MTNDKSAFIPHVEIALDNVVHNLNQIKSRLPASMSIIAIVKDNAYGCGSIMISRALEAHGVEYFAVARSDEARALRNAGICAPILILGRVTAAEASWGSASKCIFSLTDLDDCAIFAAAGRSIRCHVNIDTGMSRLGILPEELSVLFSRLCETPGITVDGVYTHLAKADNPDTGHITRQLTVFRKAIAAFREHGHNPPAVHYGNSAAIMRYPLEECSMVRPGITLYGCKPDPAQDFPLLLKNVLSLKSYVVKIKRVVAGTAISYGGRYITSSDTHIATVAIGYAHGLPRLCTNNGCVLIRGRRYPIAGTVTMDYVMVDAGAHPDMAVGDEAVAIGSQGTESITADDVARSSGTIAYEILCNISTSIERRYFRNNECVHADAGHPV